MLSGQGPEALSRWTGEFLDAGLEQGFLRDVWPRLGRQIRIVVTIAGAMYLAALYLDWVALGPGRAFLAMALLRGAVGILMAGCVLASRRPGAPLRWLLFSAPILISVAELVETWVTPRGAADGSILPFSLVMIFMAYILAPNRLRMTGTAMLVVSFLALWQQASLTGWTSPMSFLMLLYLVLANGTGYVFQLTWNRLMRRDLAMRRKLEHEVAERQRAEAEAMAANATKSRFLAVMSHEIRTPLNGVLGGVQLVQETELRPEQREMLDMVGQSGNQLAMLLDDILDLARIESGSLEPAQEAFSMAELLASVQAVLYSQARAKGLALRLEHGAMLPPAVLGDALRLRQVLINLAGNAVKFTERGEVVLALDLAEDAGRGTVRCAFTIQDTGPGLTADEQGRIFEPFEQGDASIRRRYGGSGLGLAISRKLVAAMGGELRVESAPGWGSAFSFTVELRRSEAWPSPAKAEAGAARSLSILVVDDLEANRIVAAGLLTSLGHRPHAVATGAEALEALRRERCDAVLLDLHMPDLDGMEVFRRIRSLEGGAAELPVFLMTADTERILLQSCLAAGINGVIAKPIHKSRLAALLGGVAGPEREACAEGRDVLVDPAQVGRILADLGPESWQEGVAACRASAAESLEQLEDPDPGGAKQALHRLAGLSGSFGLVRLYRLVRHAESLLEAGSPLPQEELRALVAASLAGLEAMPVPAGERPTCAPVQ
jgi:signal transduction histidine kinase/CheY-like chemotaxis protein